MMRAQGYIRSRTGQHRYKGNHSGGLRMPSRRQVLADALTVPALGRPAIGKAEPSRVLKFIPQSDVSVIDPVWSTAYNTRNHGYMVFDTLFGMDSQYQIQPQMLAGAVTAP